VVYGLAPVATGPTILPPGVVLLTGSLAMPVVCVLSAWQARFRHLFFIPVILLVTALSLIIRSASP